MAASEAPVGFTQPLCPSQDATFTLHDGRLTVDGSFITEAHLVAGAGVCPPEAPSSKCAGAYKKHFNVSYRASELTEQNAGFTYLRGTCGSGRGRCAPPH